MNNSQDACLDLSTLQKLILDLRFRSSEDHMHILKQASRLKEVQFTSEALRYPTRQTLMLVQCDDISLSTLIGQPSPRLPSGTYTLLPSEPSPA